MLKEKLIKHSLDLCVIILCFVLLFTLVSILLLLFNIMSYSLKPFFADTTQRKSSIDFYIPAEEFDFYPAIEDNENEKLLESPLEVSLVNQGVFKLTGYCACVQCCEIWSKQHPSRINDDNYIQLTASGTVPSINRTIAADWNLYPPGTELIINDHLYIVEDKGGGVKQNHIDIFFENHTSAREYFKEFSMSGEVWLVERGGEMFLCRDCGEDGLYPNVVKEEDGWIYVCPICGSKKIKSYYREDLDESY